MNTKGIIKVKADLYNYHKNKEIIELNKTQDYLTAEIDEECLGENTINKKSTLNKIKWVVIKEKVWINLLKDYSTSKKADQFFFESIKSSESITNIYYGNTVSVDIKEIAYKITDGDVYLLIPFVNYPEYNPETSIRFVYLAEPRVRYCYFEPKKLNETDKEYIDDNFFFYGEPVKINGSFHLIPDFRLDNENVEAYIDIVNNDNLSQILDSIKIDIPKYIKNSSYNLNFSFSIIVKETWREKLNHMENDTKSLVLIIRFDFSDNPTKKLKNYNSVIDFEQWRILDAENNIWSNIPMSGVIKVPYEKYKTILERLEISRTNQIAKIGNVNYNIKENNPCGFERIFIKDLADEKREEILFFDEQELFVNDQTSKSFNIICGDDESKNVNIRIEGLTNLTVTCQNILLEPNESHADIKNLINFDKIVPALRAKSNYIDDSKLKKDIKESSDSKQDNVKIVNNNQQNYEYNRRKESPILKSGSKNNNYEDSGYEYEKSKTIENDYDLKASKEKIDGASILGWKEGVDYKRNQNEKTALVELTNLKYQYNKTFLENISNEITQDVINKIWCLNYFKLGTHQAQTYFVPISTCRYPNQIIKIKVYPDIKWELAFEFIVKASNYKAANMPTGNVFKKHQEKARDAGYEKWLLDKKSGRGGLTTIALGVGLTAEWNNKKEKQTLSIEIKKRIEVLAETLANVSDILQNAINYAQSTAKKTAIPLAFDIRYPKMVFAGAWSLTQDKNEVYTQGELNIGLKPIIGAEVIVDILGMAIVAASYGTTGNPAAARLIQNFRGTLDKLGASVTFTATFYGELEIEMEALKIAKGEIKTDGKTTIGGKMGVIVELIISIGGKFKAEDKKWALNFKAIARIKGQAYFGGDFIFNKDKKGFYVEPILKFSGLIIEGEVEGEVGWWKSSFKLEEKILEEDTYPLERTYL